MKRICIGKIVSAHGIKGLVKILPKCEDTVLLNGTLYTSETGGETLDIKLKNSSGKYILADIAGITSREAAENSRCSLFVSRETLPDLDDSTEFYTQDFVNLEVCDSKNEVIGKIIAVENYGAGDLLDIKLSTAKTFLLPFRDENIQKIDLENGYVQIKDYEDFLF